MDYFHPNHPAWSISAPERLEKLRIKFPDYTWSDKTLVREQRLSCYPDLPFVIARDPSWTPTQAFVYVLVVGDKLVHLHGTSPQIHELNTEHLYLNAETVLDYLSFFCFFVRGESGPFYVAHSLESEYLPSSVRKNGDDEIATSRDRLCDVFQSPRWFDRGENGNWHASATIMYANAIFVTDLVIHPTGNIEMKNDTPLMADLSHTIDAPLFPETTDKEHS